MGELVQLLSGVDLPARSVEAQKARLWGGLGGPCEATGLMTKGSRGKGSTPSAPRDGGACGGYSSSDPKERGHVSLQAAPRSKPRARRASKRGGRPTDRRAAATQEAELADEVEEDELGMLLVLLDDVGGALGGSFDGDLDNSSNGALAASTGHRWGRVGGGLTPPVEAYDIVDGASSEVSSEGSASAYGGQPFSCCAGRGRQLRETSPNSRTHVLGAVEIPQSISLLPEACELRYAGGADQRASARKAGAVCGAVVERLHPSGAKARARTTFAPGVGSGGRALRSL